MRDQFSERGQILNASVYENELQQILRQHYRRVSKLFGIALRQQLVKHFLPEETKAIDEKVNSALREFINLTTALHARLIIQTTQTEINGAISFGVGLQLPEVFAGSRNLVVAEEAQNEFNRRAKSRIETIAVTETQTASEGSKIIEAQTIANDVSAITGVPQEEVLFKEWSSVLDSRTRESHVLADGQRVGVNDPFIVGGELLRFPSDTSLGASLENVINCRCISAIVVNDQAIAEAIDTRVKPQTGKPLPTLQGVLGA